MALITQRPDRNAAAGLQSGGETRPALQSVTRTGRVVMLDRDGTVIAQKNYLSCVEDVELLPNAAAGLKRLRELGLRVALVTNQSGIGRGYFSREQVDRVHARMRELLAAEGAGVDAIYICPHTPEENCSCRKPHPGLMLQATGELGCDPVSAFMIGDKDCDIECGRNCGATTILVRTGYGREHLASGRVRPDFVVNDLMEAASQIATMLEDYSMEQTAAGLVTGASELLKKHLLGSITTKQRVLEDCADVILKAAAEVVGSFRSGGKVLLCGNGGSAGDCQHIAGEMVSTLSHDFPRPGLAAIALTTDTSILTASANDFGYEGIFERQVQALGKPGDILIGISTSGNSENVFRALRYASSHGIRTVALTGASGGRMAEIAEIAVRIPSMNTQHIQEAHIAVGHILCALVERTLFRPGE